MAKCSDLRSPHARHDLSTAKATIGELFGKIHEIRRKAEQSDAMVQEICRDIKKLDHAKKHLTSTITALRRLAMLVNAVGACLRFRLARRHAGPAAWLPYNAVRTGCALLFNMQISCS